MHHPVPSMSGYSSDPALPRVKRKPPPQIDMSVRYPSPDPSDPFAPLWVLRNRTSSALLGAPPSELNLPTTTSPNIINNRRSSYDLYPSLPVGPASPPISPSSSRDHTTGRESNFNTPPKPRENHYRRRSQSAPIGGTIFPSASFPFPNIQSSLALNDLHQISPPPSLVRDSSNSDSSGTDVDASPVVVDSERAKSVVSPSPSVTGRSKLARFLLPKKASLLGMTSAGHAAASAASSPYQSATLPKSHRVRKASISPPLSVVHQSGLGSAFTKAVMLSHEGVGAVRQHQDSRAASPAIFADRHQVEAFYRIHNSTNPFLPSSSDEPEGGIDAGYYSQPEASFSHPNLGFTTFLGPNILKKARRGSSLVSPSATSIIATGSIGQSLTPTPATIAQNAVGDTPRPFPPASQSTPDSFNEPLPDPTSSGIPPTPPSAHSHQSHSSSSYIHVSTPSLAASYAAHHSSAALAASSTGAAINDDLEHAFSSPPRPSTTSSSSSTPFFRAPRLTKLSRAQSQVPPPAAGAGANTPSPLSNVASHHNTAACSIQPPSSNEWQLPIPSQLSAAASLPVISSAGIRVPFGLLFELQKTIVIFIRHFWCPLCQDYMTSVKNMAKPEMLKASGKRESMDDKGGTGENGDVQLVIISNGAQTLIEKYKQIFNLPFSVYTDPTLAVYNALGMGKDKNGDSHRHGPRDLPIRAHSADEEKAEIRTSEGGYESTFDMGMNSMHHGHRRAPSATVDANMAGGVNAKGTSYVKHGLVSGIALVMARAVKVKMPVWEKGGDVGQLGGEFVLGPGLRCTFAHRMQTPKGHAPISLVLRAAGVKLPPPVAPAAIPNPPLVPVPSQSEEAHYSADSTSKKSSPKAKKNARRDSKQHTLTSSPKKGKHQEKIQKQHISSPSLVSVTSMSGVLSASPIPAPIPIPISRSMDISSSSTITPVTFALQACRPTLMVTGTPGRASRPPSRTASGSQPHTIAMASRSLSGLHHTVNDQPPPEPNQLSQSMSQQAPTPTLHRKRRESLRALKTSLTWASISSGNKLTKRQSCGQPRSRTTSVNSVTTGSGGGKWIDAVMGIQAAFVEPETPNTIDTCATYGGEGGGLGDKGDWRTTRVLDDLDRLDVRRRDGDDSSSSSEEYGTPLIEDETDEIVVYDAGHHSRQHRQLDREQPRVLRQSRTRI